MLLLYLYFFIFPVCGYCLAPHFFVVGSEDHSSILPLECRHFALQNSQKKMPNDR